MRLFLDTEFNGFGGELISMALVTEDGTDWWYQVRDFPQYPDPWVAEHVIPVLGKAPIGDLPFRLSLHAFMADKADAIIVADWPTDLQFFFDALHGHDYSSSICPDLSCVLLSKSDCKPLLPHNALSDAGALREWFSLARLGEGA